VIDTVGLIAPRGGRADAVQTDCATDKGAAAMVTSAMRDFGRLTFCTPMPGFPARWNPDLDEDAADFAEVLRINLIGPWLAIPRRRAASGARGGDHLHGLGRGAAGGGGRGSLFGVQGGGDQCGADHGATRWPAPASASMPWRRG
jgi:hypothetical protein